MEYIITIKHNSMIEALEMHYYDYHSKRDIIEYILMYHPELKNDLWEEYQKEYEKSFIAYTLAKNNFTKYLMGVLKKENFNWTVVDFSEKTIKVEEK